MPKPPKITCWCCGRDQSWKKKIDGHYVCGFCAKHLEEAMKAGLSPEMAKEEIKAVARNMNPGRWPEKDLWSWNKPQNLNIEESTDKTVISGEKYQDNIMSPEPGKRRRFLQIHLREERDLKIIEWVDTVADKQRRDRGSQILKMLESMMLKETEVA